MTRSKIEERKSFSREEKEFIKLKTRGKCGHCGCKLTDQNISVDHIIPISKGGSNQEENLICLCKECNKDKSDMLADPLYYYPYLKEDYKEGIIKIFTDYIENVDYVHRTNLMCIDIIGNYITKEERKAIFQMYAGRHAKRKLQGYNMSLETISLMTRLSNMQLRKAVYKDLDDVYHMMVNKLGFDKSEAYTKISTAFLNYSIYVYRINSKIVGFFFLIPRRVAYDRDTMILSIEEVYLKYDKYLTELTCLLEGFCSFLLSKRSFLGEFICIQSRMPKLMGYLTRYMGKAYSAIREATVNGYPTVFVTREAKCMSSFLYVDDTEYQTWLHTIYNTPSDRELTPILKHSRVLTKSTKGNYLSFLPLGEPNAYLGDTIVT